MTKFKVGDRVRVYEGLNSGVAFVVDIHAGSIWVSGNSSEFPDVLRGRAFHSKQCRRLKPKKKPREWRVGRCTGCGSMVDFGDRVVVSMPHTLDCVAWRSTIKPEIETITVAEVKE